MITFGHARAKLADLHRHIWASHRRWPDNLPKQLKEFNSVDRRRGLVIDDLVVTQDGATPRTRYYERATMLIKRAVLMLLLLPCLVSTHCMIADLFTKALDKGSFIKFRDVMMNIHNPLREALAAAVCQMHGDAKRIANRLARQL